MTRKVILALLVASISAWTAFAGPEEYSRLARISVLEGNVGFQHPNLVDWTAASINMALQPGDRIYTGIDGRVEMQFDDGSAVRLANQTDVEILALTDNLIQFRILAGLCSLSVRSSLAFEVNTPAAAFTTLKKGVYRFDVTESGDTDGIARAGTIEAENSYFHRLIESGELLHIVAGNAGDPQLSRYEGRDFWDEWNDRRDAEMLANDSRRFLPETVYMGAGELDSFGRWIVDDSYGPAWVPYAVNSVWSPYSAGRWWYRPKWGWTWVSYEPWGWLPYHYGRWHHHPSYGWCWLPGAAFTFNFWSPALVRFYQGPSWISWCPLGPGDYYNVNNYYYHSTYSHQINNLRLTQNRSPQDLVNRDAAYAFRTVSTHQFTSASLGGTDRHRPAESIDQPWRRGRIVTEQPNVNPTSMSFSPAPDRAPTHPTIEHTLPSIVRTLPPGDLQSRNQLIPITRAESGVGSTAGRMARGSSADEGKIRSGNYGPQREGSAAAVGGNERGISIGTVPAVGVNPRSERSNPENAPRGRFYQGGSSGSGNAVASPESGRESFGGNPGSRAAGSSLGSGASIAIPGSSERQRMAIPRPASVPQRRMDSARPAQPTPPQIRSEQPRPPSRSEPQSVTPHASPRGNSGDSMRSSPPTKPQGASSGAPRNRGN